MRAGRHRPPWFSFVLAVAVSGCGGKHPSKIDSGIDPEKKLAAVTEEEGDRLCNLSLEFMAQTSNLAHEYCTNLGMVAGSSGATTSEVRRLCREQYEDCIRVTKPEDVLKLWADSITCFDRLPPSVECKTNVGAVEQCYTDAAYAMAETEWPCDVFTLDSYPLMPLLARPASCAQVEADCAEIF